MRVLGLSCHPHQLAFVTAKAGAKSDIGKRQRFRRNRESQSFLVSAPALTIPLKEIFWAERVKLIEGPWIPPLAPQPRPAFNFVFGAESRLLRTKLLLSARRPIITQLRHLAGDFRDIDDRPPDIFAGSLNVIDGRLHRRPTTADDADDAEIVEQRSKGHPRCLVPHRNQLSP